MGLIKAALGSAGGVLGDQWKEYFYCEALPADVLVSKGHKKTSGRSSNKRGSDNVISNGSVIAVADGQCMMIVDQGRIVDVCAEPGQYTYDISSEPSLFYGDLRENISAVMSSIADRFTFGGEAPKDQRIYYFNTREIIGNKYGTPSPVPFRVVDQRAGIDMDIGIRCFGEYSYKLVNPVLFYCNVCGNVSDVYKRQELDSQLKSELLTALQPAFSKISEQGIRYSAIPGHTAELAQALKDALSPRWTQYRGIEIQQIGVSSVNADPDDEKTIKELQKNAAYANPSLGAAALVGAQADSMRAAADNPGGAAMGFMGMNMVQASGGVNAQDLYQMGAAAQAAAVQNGQAAQNARTLQNSQGQSQISPQAGTWICPNCGATASGKFCQECGAKKPEPPKFGPDGWTCPECGTLNKGKFCSECGAKKPAGAPKYKCDKCGWEPDDPTRPPKFCPNCGDPFNDDDIVE